MYQESWNQIMQSVGGTLRNIYEMHAKSKEENDPYEDYDAANFAIILICDGIDKLPVEFEQKMYQYGFYDPDMCNHAVAEMKNHQHVKKTYKKEAPNLKTFGNPQMPSKEYSYATSNVTHVFASEFDTKRLQAIMEEEEIVGFKSNGDPINKKIVNLHQNCKDKDYYKWIIEPVQHLGEENIPPVKFFFGAKHENSGKIESHLIFFKGFCCNSDPSYCQVIDAGTIPNAKSITSLVKALDREPQCAGIAGEIEVFTPTNHELGCGIKFIN